LGAGDRPGLNLHWGGVGLVLIFLFLFGKSIRRGAVASLKGFTGSSFTGMAARGRRPSPTSLFIFPPGVLPKRWDRKIPQNCPGALHRLGNKIKSKVTTSQLLFFNSPFTYLFHFCASLYARMQVRPARAFLCVMLRNLSAHRYQVSNVLLECLHTTYRTCIR